MNALTIADTAIRQDAAGRFSLNDLHKAAGGEKRHQPSDWLRLQQTQALVAELEREAPGIPGTDVVLGVGTFARRELVIAYAAWIAPAFHLRVLRTFDAATRNPNQVAPVALSRLDLLQLAMQAETERLAMAHQVAALTPKAAALDRLSAADDSVCISDGAKALGVPPRKFFGWLQEHRWIFRRHGSDRWLPYADRQQAGVLEVRTTTVKRGDNSEKLIEQTLITAKGLARLAQLLGSDGATA